jgi:hypothetical protein
MLEKNKKITKNQTSSEVAKWLIFSPFCHSFFVECDQFWSQNGDESVEKVYPFGQKKVTF